MAKTEERTGGWLTIRQASSHPVGLILVSTHLSEEAPDGTGPIPMRYHFLKGKPVYIEDQVDFEEFQKQEWLNDPPQNKADPRLTSPLFNVGPQEEPAEPDLSPESLAAMMALMRETLKAAGKDPDEVVRQALTGVTSESLPEEARAGQL